ncbi:hypothetical protein MBM_08971 [Drepanopeziza brunnea f. sp. 'multigermtubi' MB_m1]|uniref:Uncharacterized protein n=1 Tax=Marssonina brunnea f. sp. multigermtubi (strain MB_m1) TaxID=1072389 RepID=K1WKI1_MARBU|nr:uncharacterized protein MBM_08971 [Drepanopeziza brunnea f. sp. 'multigermtubi' MB_m1]EKD12742.1 hypothetical protein MBM_08971 [Drepanopeziza brunnea f. sp. 'multigermtubi' MB_m1]
MIDLTGSPSPSLEARLRPRASTSDRPMRSLARQAEIAAASRVAESHLAETRLGEPTSMELVSGIDSAPQEKHQTHQCSETALTTPCNRRDISSNLRVRAPARLPGKAFKTPPLLGESTRREDNPGPHGRGDDQNQPTNQTDRQTETETTSQDRESGERASQNRRTQVERANSTSTLQAESGTGTGMSDGAVEQYRGLPQGREEDGGGLPGTLTPPPPCMFIAWRELAVHLYTGRMEKERIVDSSRKTDSSYELREANDQLWAKFKLCTRVSRHTVISFTVL